MKKSETTEANYPERLNFSAVAMGADFRSMGVKDLMYGNS